MAGYNGYKMSNNAVQAYEDGEMLMSKWTKTAIIANIKEQADDGEVSLKCSLTVLKKISAGVLRDRCLYRSSWHHTGKYYHETDFYSLDTSAIEELTNEDLQQMALDYKEEQERIKREKAEDTGKKCECTFLVWPSFGKHARPEEITKVGIIKGNWFYRPNGRKKSIYARGFREIREISE